MIESLKADLATLSDTVPLLAKGVTAVRHEAEALETAADDLLVQVGEALQESGGLLGKVRDALPGLTVQSETHEKSVADGGDGAKTAWDGSRDDMGAAESRLEGDLANVLEARITLATALAEAGTRIDQSAAAGDDAVARLEHASEDAATRLNAASQAFTDAVSQLTELLGTARTSIGDASDALLARLDALGPELAEDAQEILEALTRKKEEHLAALRGHLQDLEEHIHPAVDDIGEKGQRMVTGPLGEAALDLQTELQALGASAGKHEVALRTNGKTFEQALAEVEGEARLVPRGLHQIEAAIQNLRR